MGEMILAAVFGYLLGSVPFGMVITRALGLGDLRRIGSGNIGATNVLRTGHKGAALATLLLDSGKAALAVLLARAIGGEAAGIAAGTAAFIGHLFPVWLRFRGGKGVATFLGTVLALHWPLGLAACAAWLLSAALSRISSVGALSAAAASVPLAALMGQGALVLPCLLMAALIVLRHRDNIARIRAGTESRIGRRK